MGLFDAPTPMTRPAYLNQQQQASPLDSILGLLSNPGVSAGLSDLGAGLLSAPNWKGGFQQAGLRATQMEPYRQEASQLQKDKTLAAAQSNQTVAYLKKVGRTDLAEFVMLGQMDPKTAIKQYYDEAHAQPPAAPTTADITEFQFAKQQGFTGSFQDWLAQSRAAPGGGTGKTALSATWGVDNDPASPTYGKPVLGQLNDAGVFVKTQMPAGVSAMDPMALQSGKTGATADAKSAAAARTALPGAEQTVAITKQAIDTIRNDTEALQEHFGKFAGVVPQQMIPMTIPGTAKGRFDVNQAQAGGQAFMQARQMLKGGGQITDYEGRRAEAAYSKMDAAARAGDQEQYLTALDEFEQAVEAGYQKLIAAANGGYAAGSDAVTGGQSGTVAGQTFTYNPATGELE